MKKEENSNLADKHATQNAETSNMPSNQVPKHRSNDKEQENTVQSDANGISRDFGSGDFGSEEARADAEKGNPGEAGNMPNTEEK
jgi:hypothetical protein